MTPETPPPPPPMEAKGIGEAARLGGVFFEPGKAFADIARRPTWIVPLLLLILAGPFGMAFDYVLGSRVGFDRIVDKQMESRLSQMSADQRAAAERAIPLQKKFAPVGYYAAGLIVVPLLGLLCAGVLTGIVGGILSAGVKFKQVLAIYFYSGLPNIIWALLAIVVMYLKPPDDFDIRNPIAFNLGAFLDPAGSKFLYALATALDVFTFWRLYLLAFGLKVAAGKKLSMGGALAAVIVPWACVALIGAAVAGAFG